MRIISGKFKNRKIKAPKDIRPATSNVRDAIFNIISFAGIENAHFLDLFAGSGAIGIEALSRGASFATFIDGSKQSIRFINQNLKDFNLENNSKVIFYDCLKAIKKMNTSFDYISIDPPFIMYKQNPGYINNLLSEISKRNVINENGIIFLEEPTYSKREIEIKHLSLKDKRRYGSSNLLKYIKN